MWVYVCGLGTLVGSLFITMVSITCIQYTYYSHLNEMRFNRKRIQIINCNNRTCFTQNPPPPPVIRTILQLKKQIRILRVIGHFAMDCRLIKSSAFKTQLIACTDLKRRLVFNNERTFKLILNSFKKIRCKDVRCFSQSRIIYTLTNSLAFITFCT